MTQGNVSDDRQKIPPDGVVLIAEMAGEDDEDTSLLRQMADRALTYIESFDACERISDKYFGGGAGGVFAIFLFHLTPYRKPEDEWMWVVVGDVPTLYLHLVDAPGPKEVFDSYVSALRRWVAFARSGISDAPPDVPPLKLPLTQECANDIERRVNSLEEILGPLFSE